MDEGQRIERGGWWKMGRKGYRVGSVKIKRLGRFKGESRKGASIQEILYFQLHL